MADSTKGRTGIIVSVVVCLVGAAILWWDPVTEGLTLRGVFLPVSDPMDTRSQSLSDPPSG